MAVGDDIQEGIAGAGEKGVEEVTKSKGFEDIPGYTEEKQTIVDEDQINEQFDPANTGKLRCSWISSEPYAIFRSRTSM